ncbi:Metallo-hydrolase/oxidoreductase [Gonapodya prolifera JEL478]|uniref:Metallo-hydrolase/oxidoreductase n=1 Tax=Gonapodya prolifera (strain JEL478) TaxID=1344416 RepID=A0A139A6K8_GONPJ|nr:Metallo-hydrolase/oxidoreductase [Gonapodya prolifera JEL478]|eukprot:KXS12401.1 Metallo-hydrolase/oxidoreductase [Gonapodya prolifera JEL478]
MLKQPVAHAAAGPSPPELDPLPNVEKISPRVLRVLGLNPSSYTLQGTNNYILGTGRERIIIDSGEGIAGWDTLLKEALEKEGATISHILLTHFHHDHVGGVSQIKSICKNPTPVAHKKLCLSTGDTIPSPIYTDIADGQTFRVEGATVRAIATPGHCDDHVAFYLEEERAIIAGDCVLGFGTTVFQELGEYMASLRKMLWLSQDLGRVYPGHGPVIEDGKAKLEFYIKHRQDREDQIISVLQRSHTSSTPSDPPVAQGSYEAWTIKELVQVIYAAYPPHLQLAAESSVLLHLRKLVSEEKVKVLSGDGADKFLLLKAGDGNAAAL